MTDDKHCAFPECGGWRIKDSIYCVAHTRKFSPEKLDIVPKNIIEAMDDPEYFGTLFDDMETWKTWRTTLKALFNLEMDADEVETYKQITQREKLPEKAFREAYLIVGRRGGKSFLSALITVYMACVCDWSKYLRKGEPAEVMLLANDRLQAGVVLSYVREILELPKFKGMVKRGRSLKESIELKNGINIRIATASFRGIRGRTIVCAILDELAFWRWEGRNPDAEILRAIKPSMLTIPRSMIIGISTPYMKSGVVYEAFSKHYAKEDAPVLVVRGGSTEFNPGLDRTFIEQEIEADSANRAEYYAEFREDLEAFLPGELVDSCIIPERGTLPYNKDQRYVCFVDPASGQGKDSFTLAIAHTEKDTGQIVVDVLEERMPPFSPKTIIKEFAKIMSYYGLAKCTGDRYAIGYVGELFREHGITYECSNLSASEIYLECQSLFTVGKIELPDNKKMREQFKNLERRTRSGGRDQVSHPQFAEFHDDSCNSAAGVCVMLALQPTVSLQEAMKNLPSRDSDLQRSGGRDLNIHPRKELSESEKENMFKGYLRRR